MTLPRDDNSRLVCALLITLAAGTACGRIASAERLNEPSVHRADGDSTTPRPPWPRTRPTPSPTFSSNDRSRFAAARALVDHGTFVVGRRDRTVVLASGPAVLASRDMLHAVVLFQAGYQARVGSDRGIIFEDGWQSVDKVLHPTTLEFYSTKPPLLTVLAAGEYWVLKRLFGWSIVEQRWEVIRVIVVTFNILPLVLYLAVLAALARRLGGSDVTVYTLVAAGGFATLVTPFLITFNNHTPATTAAALALWATVKVRDGGGAWSYALAGLSAGFAACMELPATSLAAGLFAYLAWKDPKRTFAYFVPAAAVPVLALVGTNYLQLGRLSMAYAEFGGPWYEYEGSHWRVAPGQFKRGIDFAGRNGETKDVYAFHLLLGHHGWFSLMPIMFLGLAGMGMALGKVQSAECRVQNEEAEAGPSSSSALHSALCTLHFRVGLFTLLVSTVVIAFYIFKSDNYGGWSNGPRWLMWLTPLWLVTMVPAVEVLLRGRAGRALVLVLLGLSVASMHYQNWNPWRHPWLYNWLEACGRIPY